MQKHGNDTRDPGDRRGDSRPLGVREAERQRQASKARIGGRFTKSVQKPGHGISFPVERAAPPAATVALIGS